MEGLLKNRTILLVEDDESLRETYRDLILLEGARVLDAGGGIEAFEIFKKNEIDCIVSDFQMPKGTGIDLLKWVRSASANKDCPFIFVTGLAHISEAEGMRLGATGFFYKPIDFDKVIQSINKNIRPANAPR